MEIYLDGASLQDIERYAHDDRVSGFTSNPSLMKKAGVSDYAIFAKQAVARLEGTGKTISFEVLADDWPNMKRQAKLIASWGDNVYVKIPIMNTKGESSIDLIDELQDLNLNITAVMTMDQIDALAAVDRKHHIVSIFAGRIADTGRDAEHYIFQAKRRLKHAKVLWASTREVFNYYQAENWEADIITMDAALIEKLKLYGKDLHEYSRETVQQFHNDGKGITL